MKWNYISESIGGIEHVHISSLGGAYAGKDPSLVVEDDSGLLVGLHDIVWSSNLLQKLDGVYGLQDAT